MPTGAGADGHGGPDGEADRLAGGANQLVTQSPAGFDQRREVKLGKVLNYVFCTKMHNVFHTATVLFLNCLHLTSEKMII